MLCVDCLEDMVADDYIRETEHYSYRLNAISQVMEGTLPPQVQRQEHL